MIQWQHYPKSLSPPDFLLNVIDCFKEVEEEINSEKYRLRSNKVLSIVRPYLEGIGFDVEKGKKKAERIRVPVLFGLNGVPEKAFDADAHHIKNHVVLEIEAGRAVDNNAFLKDLFQACMMHNVNYLVLAVCNLYQPGSKTSKDFEKVVRFFDTLYASERLKLPLNGIILIGY